MQRIVPPQEMRMEITCVEKGMLEWACDFFTLDAETYSDYFGASDEYSRR